MITQKSIKTRTRLTRGLLLHHHHHHHHHHYHCISGCYGADVAEETMHQGNLLNLNNASMQPTA
jgi:hypothetical protein